ncbi:hypothetical protein ACROYT_G009056 [Oculina patagonica]
MLIVNATDDRDKPSSHKDVVIKHAVQGQESKELSHDVVANQELSVHITRRRKRSHSWWWGRRRTTRRNPSYITRPHCEHETHVHFRTRCCSGKFINDPLLQTCCAGRIVRKSMVPFFCHPSYGCNCFWFDTNRQKCCYGKNKLGCKDVQPVCGLVRYNASTHACCDGRYVYYFSSNKCCHRSVMSRSRTCPV